MARYQEDHGFPGTPTRAQPPALFGIRDGAAWVAEDVFITRKSCGDMLVEHWDVRGVRSAVVRKDSEGFLRAIWLKLAEGAIEGIPDSTR